MNHIVYFILEKKLAVKKPHFDQFLTYRISSYSFRGNYSVLDLEIQRSQYIRLKVTVNKCAETIQGRKLYEEIRYVEVGVNEFAVGRF